MPHNQIITLIKIIKEKIELFCLFFNLRQNKRGKVLPPEGAFSYSLSLRSPAHLFAVGEQGMGYHLMRRLPKYVALNNIDNIVCMYSKTQAILVNQSH